MVLLYIIDYFILFKYIVEENTTPTVEQERIMPTIEQDKTLETSERHLEGH